MAGPAIRAMELGKRLADEFDVTISSPCPTDLPALDEANFMLRCGLSKSALYELARSCDIIYLQANVLKPYPALASLGKYLVVDLYDPYLLSVLAQYADDPVSSSASYRLMHKVLEKHMTVCDFSICASERQRDYWLGRYCSIGRLTPAIYKYDPSFRKLIDVVPFGLPATPPVRNGAGLKGLFPGISKDDFVLIWGGGIWEWFDPLTVIEAVYLLSKSHPQLKLFFMGWKSPNPQVPLMPVAIKAKEHARIRGMLDNKVFFHDSWVPYENRVNFLLDADVAVSAHFDLPETRFAFRTRILDYFWAGLPIITTCGDQLADMINTQEAGVTLPYADPAAWAKAISQLMDDNMLLQHYRHGSRHLADQFVWDKAVQPLTSFCREPYHLPSYSPVRMPSLVERARAVYSRGGTDLVLKRSKVALEDIWRK